MNLHEARQIARQVEAGEIRVLVKDENFDRVREAYHKLNRSDPATVERRREDMRLRDVIMHAAGKSKEPTSTDHPKTLTDSQKGVLRWLAKEDHSAFGECHGPDLDALVLNGLVEIHGTTGGAVVTVTDAGRTALAITTASQGAA